RESPDFIAAVAGGVLDAERLMPQQPAKRFVLVQQDGRYSVAVVGDNVAAHRFPPLVRSSCFHAVCPSHRLCVVRVAEANGPEPRAGAVPAPRMLAQVETRASAETVTEPIRLFGRQRRGPVTEPAGD